MSNLSSQEKQELIDRAVDAIRNAGGDISYYSFDLVTGMSPASCDIAMQLLLDGGYADHNTKTGRLTLRAPGLRAVV